MTPALVNSTPVQDTAQRVTAARSVSAPRPVQLSIRAQDPAALLRALRHAYDAVQADAASNWPQLPGTQGDGWDIS